MAADHGYKHEILTARQSGAATLVADADNRGEWPPATASIWAAAWQVG